MAQTITPVVHGGSRRRWAGSITLHVFGATLAAGALGLALGAAGGLLGAPWGRPGMLIVAAIAGAYAAREVFGLPVPIPELRRQVPEWWRTAFGPRSAAFLYGLGLGPGFLTHLRHGTFVAVAAVAIVVGDPLLGMTMLAPFGLARALGVVLASAGRRVPVVSEIGDRLERMGSGNMPRAANAVASVALALVASTTTIEAGSPPGWVWPGVLAFTFAWAAVAKLAGRAAWRDALRAYRLPDPVERTARVAIPAAEASVAPLLIAGQAEWSSGLALILLGGFSMAIFRLRKDGSLPCGCFGGKKQRSVGWLLARNGALALIATISLLVGSSVPLPTLRGGSDSIVAALAVAGLGLAAWLGVRAAELWRVRELRR